MVTYEIASAEFNDGLISIEYEIDGVLDMITVDAAFEPFSKFCPSDECKLMDEYGHYHARFDSYLNLHWLIEIEEQNQSYITYRVVNCNQIIEQLIYEKANS